MSTDYSTYEHVYTGSEVNIQYLQEVLHKAGIQSIVKNNFESGLRAGFGGGLPGQVQLLVQNSHAEEALSIVKATFPEA
ncbi:putative signal transducing protein [Mesonia aestuariivivens]|uniref:DUF2007 domain-containing protein n=1 Tax=Mesonia aestuariivivens TaxID=2796128 RepID=A0ABS6W0E6_9FLAO|nr:DUF2007 domain-containing protein [Mesonia aestuariivivens]MBW2961323.1 DUF2007 domain-containing protein [Mesonia aestuariivivens]